MLYFTQDIDKLAKSEKKFSDIMHEDDKGRTPEERVYIKRVLPDNPTSLQRVLFNSEVVESRHNKNFDTSKYINSFPSPSDAINNRIKGIPTEEFEGYDITKITENFMEIDSHYARFDMSLPTHTKAGYIFNLYDGGMLILEKKLSISDVINKKVNIQITLEETGKHTLTSAIRNEMSFIEEESNELTIFVKQ
jgi:hypothetical protein